MKWFFLNAKNRLAFAARHPFYTLKALGRELTLADERFLASVTGGRPSEIRHFLNEPFEAPGFLEHLRRCGSAFADRDSVGADFFAKKVLVQYAVIRASKPDTVVETGVANGVSTSYLLLALEKNQKGTLHSIDMDDRSFLPAGKATGWVVPEGLRGRWKLHLGDARSVLPELLERLGEIDLFIHDSLHTYEHMKFEFEQAYPRLRPGGVLLADDALWNAAFPDFARAARARKARIVRGVGLLWK